MNALTDADGEQFAAAIVEMALRKGASAAQAQTVKTRYFEIDFDHRGVDLIRTTEGEVTTITLFRDGKRASSTINGRQPDEIHAAIIGALIAADAGVIDPANDVAGAISLPPSHHGPVEADHRKMLSRVEAFILELGARYPLVRCRNNLYHFTDAETVFVNSRGLHQKQRRGRYGFDVVFAAKDGPKTTSLNYRRCSAYAPFDSLFAACSVERLLNEMVRSLDSRSVPKKFLGDVIFTPECLVRFVSVLAAALSGPALFAGTTPYKNKKDRAIASPLFSLFNRPGASEFPGGSDFDGYGVPTSDLDVIKGGVLNEFLVDYFFARKLGVLQTAGASNFVIAAGEESVDEIVGRTKRGILFSRFSGGAPNDYLDFSGVAKNSFYIEDGEIRYALNETMISGNLQDVLQSIHAISRESVNFGDGCYPFVAASGVTISSK